MTSSAGLLVEVVQADEPAIDVRQLEIRGRRAQLLHRAGGFDHNESSSDHEFRKMQLPCANLIRPTTSRSSPAPPELPEPPPERFQFSLKQLLAFMLVSAILAACDCGT